MPPQYNRIPEIAMVPEDMPAMVEAINTAIRAVNEVMQEINLLDSSIRGNDGYTPTFNSDVDMQDLRVKNLARSKDGGDAVTRRELEEIGILGNAAGVVFSSPVQFSAGASSAPSSGGGDELTTGEDVIDAVTEIVAGAIPVAVAGEPITIQRYGIPGQTEGSLILGRNGNGKAEFVEVRNGMLQTHSTDTVAMLTIIAHQLERLCNAIPTLGSTHRTRRRRHFALTSSDDLD